MGVRWAGSWPAVVVGSGMPRTMWLVAVVCALMACQTAAPRRSRALDLTRVSLDVPGVSGLSGLTTDGNGHLWAVSERDWALVEFHAGDVLRKVDLPPMGEEIDLEAITWLSANRFALGTERDVERDTDDIIEIRVVGDKAIESRRWHLHYAPLGLEPEPNQGIEALCALGDEWLLAIGEPVVTDPATGQRRAPMWRATTSGKGVTHGWLQLTSEEGKIAGLACRPLGDEAYEIVAVERHFGVMRLVGFQLFGAEPAGSTHVARVLVELHDKLDQNPNLEGVTWGPDRAIWLVVDNAWRRVRGPNELIRLGRLPMR